MVKKSRKRRVVSIAGMQSKKLHNYFGRCTKFIHMHNVIVSVSNNTKITTLQIYTIS